MLWINTHHLRSSFFLHLADTFYWYIYMLIAHYLVEMYLFHAINGLGDWSIDKRSEIYWPRYFFWFYSISYCNTPNLPSVICWQWTGLTRDNPALFCKTIDIWRCIQRHPIRDKAWGSCIYFKTRKFRESQRPRWLKSRKLDPKGEDEDRRRRWWLSISKFDFMNRGLCCRSIFFFFFFILGSG